MVVDNCLKKYYIGINKLLTGNVASIKNNKAIGYYLSN